MQNWLHLLHVLDNMHLTPKDQHDVDYTRVRHWALNGQGRFYRQTVILSDVAAPELRSVFAKYCNNYAGSVQFRPVVPSNGCLSEISLYLPQAFHRLPIAGSSAVDSAIDADARFAYFTRRILPKLKERGLRCRTLIFIPSYLDFVRVRNHMKADGASFVQVADYAENAKIARARGLFYHGRKPILLLTERVHFFRRYRIRGARHIFFYQLPVYPQFYADIANWLAERPPPDDDEDDQSSAAAAAEEASAASTVTVLYSRLDALRLANVVGMERASQFLKSEKDLHMVITDRE